MTDQGWVSVYRKLLSKSIWLESTPEQKTVLITLLLMANHAPKKWEWKGEIYEVQPGQFVTSLDSIAKKSGKGVSIQNVRTALKRFEKLGFLTSESTNKNRLITIGKWAFYQGDEGRANKEVNKQLTSSQQAANKQLTTNNNVNNVNNDNKDTSSNSDLNDRFNVIWTQYPHKKGKPVAFRAYSKAIKDGVTDDIILDGIDRYKKEIAFKNTDKQFIANGSTWFNQRRWEDEYIVSPQDSQRAHDEEKALNAIDEINKLGWEDANGARI